jgi:hypothetical protein
MSVMASVRPTRRTAALAGARGVREVALLASLYVGYSLTRVLAAHDLASARSRARRILDLEGVLHLDVESALNRAVSGVAWLAVPMDYWYCALHYLVTPVVLGWLYFRRPAAYGRARNAIVIASALGLLGYLAFPTAPPRLMGGTQYVDTLARFAQFGWWAEHASAPAGLGGLTNELAAMPSLHVGWAIWVAWAVSAHTDFRARRLAYAYPLGTALVVVCTGNHWMADAVMGLVVAVTGIALAHFVAGGGRRRSIHPLPTTGSSMR